MAIITLDDDIAEAMKKELLTYPEGHELQDKRKERKRWAARVEAAQKVLDTGLKRSLRIVELEEKGEMRERVLTEPESVAADQD